MPTMMKQSAILTQVLPLFLLLIPTYAVDEDIQSRRERTKDAILQPLKRFFSSDESRPSASSLRRSSHLLSEILKGVTFRRTITQFPDETFFVMNMNGQHCQERDEYGDNQCHYEWGQVAAGNYTVQFPDKIEAGDFVTGSLKLDRIVPYDFRCALCGEDCALEIPVINLNHTIRMPRTCPLSVHNTTKHILQHLWQYSPTKGYLATRLDGTIAIIQGKTGKTLVEVSVEAFVK